MIPTMFRFIWQNGFRDDFLEIDQSETNIACGGHVDLLTNMAAKTNFSF
jgi:hypothetical protein